VQTNTLKQLDVTYAAQLITEISKGRLRKSAKVLSLPAVHDLLM